MSLLRYKQKLLPGGMGNPQGGKGGGGGGSAPAPDPNIGRAQLMLAQISKEYLESWKTEVWPEMREQAAKQEARADEQFALDRETRAFQTQIAQEQYQRYQEKFRPLQDQMIAEAADYNTEANFQRQAALAMGDVNQQFQIGRDTNRMQMRAYGIDPTSGRYQGQEAATGVMEAATKAAAATKARTAAEQLGWARRMDAIGLGQGVFGNQATSTGLALTAGNQALQAGQTAMGNYAQMGQSMGSAYGGAMQGWQGLGNLGVQNYNAQVNAYAAQQQANATQNAGFAGGLGSAIGGIGGAALKYYLK